MRTVRYSSRAHKFQRIRLEQVLAKGWNVHAIKEFNGVTMVTVHFSPSGFAMICPNGLMQPPPKGKNKVEWNWSKMKDLAAATLPTPGLIIPNG